MVRAQHTTMLTCKECGAQFGPTDHGQTLCPRCRPDEDEQDKREDYLEYADFMMREMENEP